MCCVSCRCLKFLLDYGADPAVLDTKGFSPVHYATAYGSKHNLKLVIYAKVTPNIMCIIFWDTCSYI